VVVEKKLAICGETSPPVKASPHLEAENISQSTGTQTDDEEAQVDPNQRSRKARASKSAHGPIPELGFLGGKS
jgi:hypothetical protein